jgi:WD40 repeat protein/transcriptional regulator with XRE-family HTH domain
MAQSFYGKQDYTFGQSMLTLRTKIGLTQSGLAELLGVSRKAVSRWEAGSSYPNANHLQTLLALAVRQQIFPAGHEEGEIKAFWQAAHQKVLLDERWLHDLLRQQAPLTPASIEQNYPSGRMNMPSSLRGPRVDWADAPDVPTFYGREAELALLSEWIVQEQCRVVSLLGMGGIGKSALATRVMHQVAEQFEVVIWRSLRDSPSCDVLIDDCLQILAPQTLLDADTSLEGHLHPLMEQLRTQRVLLVLDNLEVLLEEGMGSGRMRAGFEAYARLLQQIGEIAHQSCLLLTSREIPAALVSLEGRRSPVRTVRLTGLGAEAGAELLEEKDVVSPPQERAQLVEVYRGNPLALKIVAQTIVELFGGEVAPFLQQGEVVFGGVRELLDEQFTRLSALEQTVLLWLAILREPVSLQDLLAVLSIPRTGVQVLESVERLRRRSLIEQGHRAGSFTLQSVVLEYATARLIDEASSEIEHGQLVRLLEHGLGQARAKEYLRQTQEQVFVVPLLTQLQSTFQSQADLEARLLWMLDGLRSQDQMSQGYGPANLVALLSVLRGDLRSLNLSRLALRDVFLQGVEMQDADLSEAVLQDSIFTEPLDAIWAIAVSPNGQYWAAASRGGEVRLWRDAGRTLHKVWQAHTANVSALAFSPDGNTLASGGWENTLKLWDVESCTLLWKSWQTGAIMAVAFAPDGRMLASGGFDTLIQLWNTHSGANVQTLTGQGGTVYSLAWSPDGKLLASGYSDGSICLWEPETPELSRYVQRLSAHTLWVAGLAFAPDGTRFVSASLDGTIKLWDRESLNCLHTFSDHKDRVLRVVWSPDGRTLASCSFDQTIRLWDVEESRPRAVLQGHTALIYSLAFTPDSRTLLSGSDDGTLRVWDVDRGQSLRIMGGYTVSLFGINWSPDGTQLASGGTDTLVTIWDAASLTSPRVLRGHRWVVQGVAWSPDGQFLASAGYDNSIRLWDTTTGVCLHVLQNSEGTDTLFQDVAWSPDGRLLAAGSYPRGVQVWEIATRTSLWAGQKQPTLIRRVAWSPDGTHLAGGSDDSFAYIWDGKDGTQQQRLEGHQGAVMSVAWSPDGTRLASAGGGKEDGELFVWDVQSGKRVRALAGHPGLISEVVWNPREELLVSGGSDGKLRWWDIESGASLQVQEMHQAMVHSLKVDPSGRLLASCGDDGTIQIWDLHSGDHLQTLRRDRPYERLNITSIRGLSEAQKASLRALGAFEEVSSDDPGPALDVNEGSRTSSK